MLVRRCLVMAMVTVLLVLSGAVQASQQLETVLIPVCRVEVTWERLEAVPQLPSKVTPHDDLWLWGISAAKDSVNLPFTEFGLPAFGFDDDHKDVLSLFGPITVDQLPTSTHPWTPKTPVILFSTGFTQSIVVQVITRTWHFFQLNDKREAFFENLDRSKPSYTLRCPPRDEEKEIVDSIQATRGQLLGRPDLGDQTYTYKIVTKVVDMKSIPAFLPIDQ